MAFLAATVASIAGFACSAIEHTLLLALMRDRAGDQALFLSSITIQALQRLDLRRSVDWPALPPFPGRI